MTEHLRSFLEYLRLNRNVSPNTVLAYRGDLTRFIEFLGRRVGRAAALPDISHQQVRAFLAELYDQGTARATSARKLAAIRSFVRYLCREGHLERDPGALVSTPKLDQKMPAHLDPEEMSALLETPDTARPLGRRDRAILELFYASGLRLSELVGLSVEDVNLSERMVRVLGKGGKERIVPFNRSAATAIRVYLVDRDALMRRGPAASRSQGRAPSRSERAVVCQLSRRTPVDSERRSSGPTIRLAVERQAGDQPTRDPSLVRNAPARAGRRSAGDPGAPGARASQHDPALHPHQRRAAHGAVSEDASARVRTRVQGPC